MNKASDGLIALGLVGIVAVFCILIAAFATGSANTHQEMEQDAAEYARCKSIDGAEWGGGACYYNGIKLNFNDEEE